MSLKDILDPILTRIGENELVLIVTADTNSIEEVKTAEPRFYFLRWGGLESYSTNESEAHLYSNGEILKLQELNQAWRNKPAQIPISPKPDEEGKTHFTLFSKPAEIATGQDIAVALGKYGLMRHYRFVELQKSNLSILHI